MLSGRLQFNDPSLIKAEREVVNYTGAFLLLKSTVKLRVHYILNLLIYLIHYEYEYRCEVESDPAVYFRGWR